MRTIKETYLKMNWKIILCLFAFYVFGFVESCDCNGKLISLLYHFYNLYENDQILFINITLFHHFSLGKHTFTVTSFASFLLHWNCGVFEYVINIFSVGEPWTSWHPWTSCAPKDGDDCNKVITRNRVKFFCSSCPKDTEEKPCQQCQQSCSSGLCSCRQGYTLNPGLFLLFHIVCIFQ